MPEPISPQTVLYAQVQARLVQTPFVPFRIVTTSGKAYPVPTADHASALRLLRTIEVANDDCSITSIHALHISAIEPLRVRRRRRAA